MNFFAADSSHHFEASCIPIADFKARLAHTCRPHHPPNPVQPDSLSFSHPWASSSNCVNLEGSVDLDSCGSILSLGLSLCSSSNHGIARLHWSLGPTRTHARHHAIFLAKTASRHLDRPSCLLVTYTYLNFFEHLVFPDFRLSGRHTEFDDSDKQCCSDSA